MISQLPIARTLCGTCAVVFAFCTEAPAAEVSFHFDGTVSGFRQIPDRFAAQLDALGVTTGATITGTYTFDSAAPDRLDDPRYGRYSVDLIQFSIGDFRIVTSNAVISITNGDPLIPLKEPDSYAVRSDASIPSPPSIGGAGYPTLTFSFLLYEYSASAFVDDSLPLAPPDLAVFRSANPYIRFRGLNDALVHDVVFQIEHLEIVPEPAMFVLLASASLLLLRKRL